MARKLCAKEGCEDQSISRGLCPKHYQALRRREKDPLVGTRQRGRIPSEKVCSLCREDSYARNLCVLHYRRALRQIKRRTFAERVLALWDKYDLDAESLGWMVDPDTEEIEFQVWSSADSRNPIRLTRERFDELAETLRQDRDPESVFESWDGAAA
jgi:hypothetical protein